MSLDGASGIGSHWAQVIDLRLAEPSMQLVKVLFCVSYSTALCTYDPARVRALGTRLYAV